MTVSLKNLDVLVVDFQATGANPDTGHLLEVGWMRTRAAETGGQPTEARHAYLIELPTGVEIPRQVQKVTGISLDDLVDTVSTGSLWKKLIKAAGEVKAQSKLEHCPTVIHYSRYEVPFLRWLHKQFGSNNPFPFDIICTHKIARRLFPGLPRKGLRAVAGYLGHTVPKNRRCDFHTAATGIIWRESVTILEKDYGIKTRGALSGWLAQRPVLKERRRLFPMDPKARKNLPDAPGVYRMLRSNGDLLYIGKAKSLKKRVGSYFQNKRRHPEHLLEMISQAGDLDITQTGSAFEAAILESDDIKKFTPPYNIALNRNDRSVGFCSKDLNAAAAASGDGFQFGPFPRQESLRALSVMLGLFNDDSEDDLDARFVSRILDLPEDHVPAVDIFKNGLKLFRDAHEAILAQNPSVQAFRKLGNRLWRLKLAEKEQDTTEPEIEETDEGAEDIEWTWTAEHVCRALEGVILRSFHLIRRANWFCMLSESSLAWDSPDKKDTQRKLVLFERSRLTSSSLLSPDEDIPIPHGAASSRLQRQRNFDISAYDRMRVATTEIRRVLTEERNIAIRLGSRIILRNNAVERLLRWV